MRPNVLCFDLVLPILIVLCSLFGPRVEAGSSELSEPAFPARQVHLDFHTSHWIPEVGARFQKTQFQQALKLGRVNWINLFAKCHHSWSYYPTAVGRPHPNLKFDLLGRQIEACHEIGARCPFYFTKAAYMIPGGKRLSLRKSNDAVSVKVPAFQTHVAIVFDY